MQKIHVKIKPGSKTQSIDKRTDMFGNTVYEVRVKSIPKGGEANKELIEVLSEHFNVAKSNVKIVSGFKSRSKIVSID